MSAEWIWQFDPLDRSGRVQVADAKGVVLAEVATIKSAQYVTKRLNAFDDLSDNLRAALDRLEQLALTEKDGLLIERIQKTIAKATKEEQ